MASIHSPAAASAAASTSAAPEAILTFLHDLPGWAWTKDEQLRYTYVSHALQVDYDIPDWVWIGHSDEDPFSRVDATFFRRTDVRVMATGHPTTHTREHLCRGVVRHMQVMKFPLRLADGLTGVAGIAFESRFGMWLPEGLAGVDDRPF